NPSLNKEFSYNFINRKTVCNFIYFFLIRVLTKCPTHFILFFFVQNLLSEQKLQAHLGKQFNQLWVRRSWGVSRNDVSFGINQNKSRNTLNSIIFCKLRLPSIVSIELYTS